MPTIGLCGRPPLRYYGGKWTLSPWLLSLLPKHRTYVEPFGGGASLLLRKTPAHAEVYNDLDSEVVNVFRVLRDPDSANELARRLLLTPFARDEFKASFEPSSDPIEWARNVIIRTHMGFGNASIMRPRGFRTRASIWTSTGFRVDSNKSGTTPARDWATFPIQIRNYVERLAGVIIENKPGIEVIRDHDRTDTLFYVDPPYVLTARSCSRHEYRHEMTDDDHRELAAILHSVKGMVILSGYPCDLYDRELYSRWKRIERPHLADGARKRTEVVWINDKAAARMPQPRLEDDCDQDHERRTDNQDRPALLAISSANLEP